MGQLGDDTAVPELIALLSDPDHRHTELRRYRSLSSLRDPRALPHLTLALQSPDADLRRCAAEALLAMDAREAVPAFLQALADPDSGIRDVAAEALGRWRVPEATELLVQALPRAPEAVQVRICHALGELLDPSTVPVADPAARRLANRIPDGGGPGPGTNRRS